MLFLKFYAYVQNQFGVSIKCIHSDNGTEFKLHDFYDKCGIIHQLTCVETPQQNAVVERKHQHLPVIAKSLLF